MRYLQPRPMSPRLRRSGSSQRGFGLVEVMLSLVMLTILMTATSVFMTNMIVSGRRTERRTQAVAVARSVVDGIRAGSVADLPGRAGDPVTLENRVRANDVAAPIQVSGRDYNYRVTYCPPVAQISGDVSHCRDTTTGAGIRHILVQVLDANDTPIYTVENVYTDLRR